MFNSAAYWRERYRQGGNSGAGSVGRLLEFKVNTVNEVITEYGIHTVIDWGCGDGWAASQFRVARYLGVDVTLAGLAPGMVPAAGEMVFTLADTYTGQTAEMGLSLDVVYHLVEDRAYKHYMRRLFASSERIVLIYSTAYDAESPCDHIRHRDFRAWVRANAPQWELVRNIPSPYPYGGHGRGDDTSWSSFYLYERTP